MALAPARLASIHSMVRGDHEWYCVARNPRCGYVTKDDRAMLEHVTGRQQDLRHLPPLDFPGPEERVA